MRTNRFDARRLGRGDEVARALDHDRSNCSGLPLRIATRWTTASTPSTAALEAVGIGHVALDELAPQARSSLAASGSRTSAAHGVSRARRRVHDLRPDEARAAGDEDLHVVGSARSSASSGSGSGPFWPWYFEPSSPAPYGVSAGSVSCTKESWPIFIPW